MKLTYSELENNNNSGGSFLAKAANAAKAAVCEGYHTYKNFYHNNIDLSSPAGSIIESFWDAACPLEPPFNPNDSPARPFDGGQCRDKQYLLTYSVNIASTTAGVDQRVTDQKILWGGFAGTYIDRSAFNANNNYQIKYGLFGTSSAYNATVANPAKLDLSGVQYYVTEPFLSIDSLSRVDGQPDNCGNLPDPLPIAPPDNITKNITIVHNGNNINTNFSFNPKISLPGLSINGSFNIFKPEFNLKLAPQFDIKPTLNLDVNPKLNLSFDLGGVNINLGGNGDNETANNINNSNNINNINNAVNNLNNTVNNIENNTDKTNDDVTIIKDKLACNPCDLLKEIKDKLFKVPTYRPFSVPEFQSIKLDNLADLGFIEIDLTVAPTKTKIIFGGEAPNVMFAGWLTWRKNGYNFAREQVTAAKSIYLAPKGANGFSICCTHNARANCLYYIEIKE